MTDTYQKSYCPKCSTMNWLRFPGDDRSRHIIFDAVQCYDCKHLYLLGENEQEQREVLTEVALLCMGIMTPEPLINSFFGPNKTGSWDGHTLEQLIDQHCTILTGRDAI